MVFPGVVIFASKYDCSNPCRVQDMSFFVFFFFKKFSENLNLDLFLKLNCTTL